MVKKTFENGDIYEGFVDRDKQPHGYGVMKFIEGVTLEGEWNNGDISSGKLMFPDETIYEGGLKNNKRHGRGIEKNADGTILYSGMWKDDFEHGFGIIILGSSKYIGQFENGEIKGQGKYIFDVATFIGTWENNATGYGSIQYNNGDYYVGPWINYKKEGDGFMIYENLDIYNGDWVDNVRSGIGFFLNANNEVFLKGEWENDEFVEGTHMTTITKYENGDFYVGNFEGDEFQGLGTM